MKTLVSSILIAVVGLAFVPVLAGPVLPTPEEASAIVRTVSPPAGLPEAVRVSNGATGSASLCDEGQRHYDEAYHNCTVEYHGCLSGEDEDGIFELDDDCDHVFRDCVEVARCEAEDMCEDR